MNMKKLIQTMTDIEQGKRQLNESAVAECGEMEGSMPAPMPAPENPGNPVTMNINLSASGMDHVADLMRLMQQAGLEKAGPAPAPTMPMRMDMENLRDKMNSLENSSLEDDVRDIEEYANEPDEEYQDHNYMLNDLAGGLNKPKKMYKPAAGGDNPMAVETIKDRLYNALSEKKAKPDYLDFDGDGDRKEPMKKALADKKKKGSVKEAELDEISSDLAKRYTKAAKMDRDFNDDDIARLAKSGQSTRDMHKKNAKRTKGIYRAKSRIENEAEVQEGAPPLSPKFIKQLQITFGDKPMLSPRETRKVEDMIDKMSIENLKQLVSADIPHVSDIAKQYIRNNTPGGMKQEAEVQAPSHELSDMSRQASRIAQMIKRKINSGEQMDDRDYNQLAELGSVLSRLGASFGPKSMKDVMIHMKQYTDDRNEEGHDYPEFDVNRFKELLAMAKSTSESMIGEISTKKAANYINKAKSQKDAEDNKNRSVPDWADKKPGKDDNEGKKKAVKDKESRKKVDEISKDLARNYYRKASKDIGDQARSADDYRSGSSNLKGRLDRTYNRDGSRTTDADREKDRDTISKYDAGRKNAERKIKNRATGIGNAAKRM